MVADLTLDKLILQEAMRGKHRALPGAVRPEPPSDSLPEASPGHGRRRSCWSCLPAAMNDSAILSWERISGCTRFNAQ